MTLLNPSSVWLNSFSASHFSNEGFVWSKNGFLKAFAVSAKRERQRNLPDRVAGPTLKIAAGVSLRRGQILFLETASSTSAFFDNIA